MSQLIASLPVAGASAPVGLIWLSRERGLCAGSALSSAQPARNRPLAGAARPCTRLGVRRRGQCLPTSTPGTIRPEALASMADTLIVQAKGGYLEARGPREPGLDARSRQGVAILRLHGTIIPRGALLGDMGQDPGRNGQPSFKAPAIAGAFGGRLSLSLQPDQQPWRCWPCNRLLGKLAPAPGDPAINRQPLPFLSTPSLALPGVGSRAGPPLFLHDQDRLFSRRLGDSTLVEPEGTRRSA